MNYYLAVDIGASSGRHILGHLENGKLVLEEIHRFSNGMVEKDGHKIWDTKALWAEILAGMKKCKEIGKIPYSMGIDTWAVDFALLDEAGQLLGDVVGYRDSRTTGMDELVYECISEDDLYFRTGIQKQPFNTIYQLMAVKTQEADLLSRAKTMLLVPDYFNYLLTGVKLTEYTNASTTQLLSPKTKEWDFELIESLGYPKEIFTKIALPGTKVGSLTDEVKAMVGFDCMVVLPATHDTGSAVVSVPTDKDRALYISSGTWSLMGTELLEANCSKESMENNLTNEGGIDYRFRYLKNIMGMWMINSAKAELAPDMSYGQLCENAKKCDITSVVDANDSRFLAPESMSKEVQAACKATGQRVPETVEEIACVIYNSLAKCYADTAKEIEDILGVSFDAINIIGGGANATYLNELTAKASGKKVLTGPIEATAIGNLAVQIMANYELKDLADIRSCIRKSFEITEYSNF